MKMTKDFFTKGVCEKLHIVHTQTGGSVWPLILKLQIGSKQITLLKLDK